MAINYKEENNIAYITFDKPDSKVNVLDSTTLLELEQILDQFKNTSARPAKLLCRISPVLDFQDMNVAVMKLIKDGKIRSQKDVKSIIYSSMVLQRFPKSLRMLNPTYRWTTSLFACMGKCLRYSID